MNSTVDVEDWRRNVMYINPFVFGVLATVGAEILALVVAAVWMFFRGKK